MKRRDFVVRMMAVALVCVGCNAFSGGGNWAGEWFLYVKENGSKEAFGAVLLDADGTGTFEPTDSDGVVPVTYQPIQYEGNSDGPLTLTINIAEDPLVLVFKAAESGVLEAELDGKTYILQFV